MSFETRRQRRFAVRYIIIALAILISSASLLQHSSHSIVRYTRGPQIFCALFWGS
ncbi:hypothetical protein BDV18DRAFT_149782 [Aspergillus unguis]